jgi:RNA polymerase sigma-70 factor (ECF subfamily)
MEKGPESLKRLFQHEFSKLVAVISKQFGLQYIELAEDIVSETFLLAAETWGLRGMPANPTAWLYTVAKQKTLYQFRRQKLLDHKILPTLKAQQTPEESDNTLIFSEETIRDSQLQMLFAICTPTIAAEAQIGLALRILCGFGIDEIAEAFLSNKETINKRLFRAKEKLRQENIKLNLPHETELVHRLDNVLHIVYLLFNEGYYSQTQNQTLRKELCLEAMRLGVMLIDYEPTNLPKTNALLALMCFHASRFTARIDGTDGQTDQPSLLYEQQNDALWDAGLIQQGFYFLNQSLQGDQLSSYHLEARIASWHCLKEDTPEKWTAILDLYNQLSLINPSPSVALNRIYSLYKVKGRQAALAEAETLNLTTNHFYYVLLGELHKASEPEKAAVYYQQAYELAKSPAERQSIQQQLNKLKMPRL